MAESRKKILAMLSERKISLDEASMLLEKLCVGSDEPSPEVQPAREAREAPKTLRYLRVVVDSSDGDKVNVRIPLSLIKTGIKLGALMPKDAADAMSEKGIDLSSLSKLDENELVEILSELKVDVESSDGETVQIFTE